MSSEVSSFYNPISTTGYLTPLQRKKLREKRKIEFPDNLPRELIPSERMKLPRLRKKSKPPKTVKKSPDSRSIASDLLVKPSSYLKDRKFFKSRSPQHLKKAKFQPLDYKKTRLDFAPSNDRSPINHVDHDSTKLPPVNHVNHVSTKFLPVNHVDPDSTKLLPVNHVDHDPTKLLPVNHVDEGTDKEVLLDGLLEFEWPSDADLKRRQQKARQELMRSEIQEEIKVPEITESAPKLYPIFLKAKSKTVLPENKKVSKGPFFVKETLNGGVQTYIDAGQKEIGAKVCATCNMIYTIAQEQDENLHSKYHDTYLTNLKFPGWQNENVVGNFIDGRVIMVKEGDKNSKLKKVQDVLFIANRDLGFPSSSFPPKAVFLLFVSTEKRICGCLVAESIDSACPVVLGHGSEDSIWRLGSWYASTEPVKAICGVNRIWVSKDNRRKKVASRMLDCLRQNFLFGHILSVTELAFTDPSPDGRQFAASYTKTDNFLVYK